MNASELWLRVDEFGLAAAGWIATWCVHSVVLCVLALAFGRVLRAGGLRERLYKVALVGAFVTTGAQAFGVGVVSPLRIELDDETRVGRPIASAAAAPALRTPEPMSVQRKPSAPLEPTVATPSAQFRWAHLLPLAALFAAFAGACSVMREFRRSKRALANRREIADAGWNLDLRELARRANVRTPELRSSALLASPIALARGELVVPERALDELDREARRALLAHELAHLARRDPQWLVATAWIEHVFALQPLQRVVRRRLALEMELACDAAAVRWTGAGLPLARCLEIVARWIALAPAAPLAASMAARGSSLVQRVEHALAPDRASATTTQRRFFGAAVVTALAVLACSGPKVEPARVAADADARNAIGSAEVAAARLSILSDGRILTAREVLYDPTDGALAKLDAHLAKLVAGMEGEPLRADDPASPRLVNDVVVLHAEPGAPWRSLQKAMESCGRRLLWNLRLTGDWPDGARTFDLPLPSDLHELAPGEDEGKVLLPGALQAGYPELTLKVLVAGSRLDPETGAPWDGSGPFVHDDSRRIEYRFAAHTTTELEMLRAPLEEFHAQWPEARLVVDARSGTLYADVVAVLETARAAGFEHFTFVGAYD